jgi:hypothetical protein
MTRTVSPAKPRRRRGTALRRSTKRLIVTLNLAEAVVGLVCLLAAYGLAERLVADQEAAGEGHVASRVVHWWGPDFSATLNMSLLIVGAAAGAVGSIIHQSMAFARSTGTEERRYVSWYLLRPLWSALLGAVAVIAVNTGLISIGDEATSSAGVAVLVLTGCLAGLFTDQVLRRLRRMLGADATPTTRRRPRTTKAPRP